MWQDGTAPDGGTCTCSSSAPAVMGQRLARQAAPGAGPGSMHSAKMCQPANLLTFVCMPTCTSVAAAASQLTGAQPQPPVRQAAPQASTRGPRSRALALHMHTQCSPCYTHCRRHSSAERVDSVCRWCWCVCKRTIRGCICRRRHLQPGPGSHIYKVQATWRPSHVAVPFYPSVPLCVAAPSTVQAGAYRSAAPCAALRSSTDRVAQHGSAPQRSTAQYYTA